MTTLVKTAKGSATIIATGVALAAASATHAAQTCDSKVARELLHTGEYRSMCDCEFVTTKFIGKLQRHDDFQLVLDSVSNTCSGFVGALTTITTASVVESRFPGPRGNDDPPDDPEPPADDPEPPADDPEPPADDPPESDDDVYNGW